MHTRRILVAIYFCGFCAITAVLILGAISRPQPIFKIFLPVFAIGTVWLAHQLFFRSGEWHRAKEKEQDDWLARHPRIAACIGLSTLLCIAIQIWAAFGP